MKQKTHKALAKRFKLKKSGKILKRKAGQGHFNSRENGKTRRNKRRDISLPKATAKQITKLLKNA